MNNMSNEEFMRNCEKAASGVLTIWAHKIRCSEQSKELLIYKKKYMQKQFFLWAEHTWGTAYCDWSDDKDALFEALRKVGAVNIAGDVGYNYVCLFFDKSKRTIK